MNQNEYNKLRGQVLRFVGINGYRNAARQLNVSVNSLKRFCDGFTVRPSTIYKIKEAWGDDYI